MTATHRAKADPTLRVTAIQRRWGSLGEWPGNPKPGQWMIIADGSPLLIMDDRDFRESWQEVEK